jgi:adenine-specific DNA-methyltransferase
MTKADTEQSIKTAIEAFQKGSLTDNALSLFKTLGYNVERRQPFKQKTFAYFKEYFLNGNDHFREDKALVSDWTYLDLLFQLSKEEISQHHSLFDTRQVDRTIIETYLFFAIGLKGESYNRTCLGQITRELNRVFPMPVMVLFKHGNTLTLSIINRRLHKRDEQKDVLQKVTLIKDVSIEKPHRAHIEILFDLSFDELLRVHRFSNFVELHNAWQKTLDTKELNKRFYQELSNWYFWAMDHVSFPDDREKDGDIRNSTNLIRLITRIIFNWFIKEKSLVPELLFDRMALSSLVKDFASGKTSNNYYKAILQNLFFGTLNQAMGERSFAKEGSFAGNRSNYGVKNLFHYADLFTVSEAEALSLFKSVPFLNGGLFDCLDKENEEGRVLYVEGFSRNPKKQATVPDFLFFGAEEEYDLNEVYGTKNKRYKVQGLIELLSHYKFTVAENTPIEEEVALDPELLGKVFENLLASYNPETKTTARKQTGSFNTPREIVNNMVDESVKEYLKDVLVKEALMSEDDAQAGLDLLFAYTEKEHPFNETETRVLINAIDKLKMLDPACGSGAFPMGILLKLVYILHKLDPKNEQWKQRQINKVDKLIEKAQDIPDSVMRGKVITGLEQSKQDIEDAFESNELDYGRKLYLIENCIYGVDIQPIAVQITKLRFFISLIIDQKKQPGKENLGIRSLPNLETKFVAANTLIGLDKPRQMTIKNPEIDRLETDIKELRHQYFSARSRREKLDYQKKDKAIRQKITELLITDGWGSAIAQQIVQFDPYDQNASAPFFDPEWMFGITDGFDVVIGNPPYKILTKNNTNISELNYFLNQYKSIQGSYSKNLFTLFIENSFTFLPKNATLSFIVPEGLFKTRSYSGCVGEMEANGFVKTITTFTEYVFENAVTGNLIFIFSKGKKGETQYYHFGESFELKKIERRENSILSKIQSETQSLSEVATLFKGMVVKDRDTVLSVEPSGKKNIFLLGKNISKWKIASNYYTNYNELEIIGGTKKLEKHNHIPRILIRRTGDTLCCAFLNDKALTESTLYSCWSISNKISSKVLLGLLNSKVLNYYNKELNITNKQGFPQILMTDLELLPIIIPTNNCQKVLETIVSYILMKQSCSFFERLIDTMVYELYFPEEIKAAGCEVIKHLTNIPELNEEWSDEKKLKTIEKAYKELSDPSHPVSLAMEKMKTVPEVRIIEGLDKQ